MVKDKTSQLGETWSIEKINQALGAKHLPIPQQQAIIRAGYENGRPDMGIKPMLVIAGAGSGKTETMTQRAVYLIVNKYIKPDEILGLTFTKKAVAEFRERIRERLEKLAENAPEMEKYFSDLEEWEGIQVNDANISTYNGFAQEIVKKYGSCLGYSENIRVITDAYAWEIMYQIVLGYRGQIMGNPAVVTVVQKALALSGQLNEHLLDVEEAEVQIKAMITQMHDFQVKGNSKKPSANLAKMIDTLELRLHLLQMVKSYQEYKQAQGIIDYSDQVRIAYQLVNQYPAIKEEINSRYKMIFLDEFQDTSAAQMLFLESLFKGKAVIAVGDPNQSIYAWRGASELSMQGFMEKFSLDSCGNQCYYPISFTFRNKARILDVANTIIRAEQPEKSFNSTNEAEISQPQPLVYTDWQESGFGEEFLPDAKPLQVQKIYPFAGEEIESDLENTDYADIRAVLKAPGGAVESYFADTDLSEAQLVAQRCGQVLEIRKQDRLVGIKEEELPTVAILVRAHSQVPALVEALEDKNIPYQVGGTAGLLYHPAIADLVAALQVTANASDGPALIRLLMGAGVGPADLAVLGEWSREIAKKQERETEKLLKAGKQISENIGENYTQIETTFDLEGRTPILLIDAVDNPPKANWQSATGNSLSVAGRKRVQKTAKILHNLRKAVGLPLDSLIDRAIKLLDLDIDIMLLETEAAENAKQALGNLIQVAKEYIANTENPSLPTFLSWLSVAEDRERGLALPGVATNPDAVQILTIHAAKGLEWTMVAVVGWDYPLSNPSSGRIPAVETDLEGIVRSSGWLTDAGELPYEMRKDSCILPQLNGLHEQMSFKEAANHIDEYRETLGQLGTIEDRRLAYVAVTRTKQYLLIGGAAGKEGSSSKRAPSSFLREIDPEKMNPIFQDCLRLYKEEKEVKKAAKAAVNKDKPRFIFRQVEKNDNAWPYHDLENYPIPASPRDYQCWPGEMTNQQKSFLKICHEIESITETDLQENQDNKALQELASADLSPHRRKALLSRFIGRENWLQKTAQLLSDYGMRTAAHPVYLPTRLAATTAKKLLVNRQAFIQELRRPMPFNVGTGGLIGTAVHQWIDAKLKGKVENLNLGYLSLEQKAAFIKLTEHWCNMQILQEWEYLESETKYQENIGVTVTAEIDAVMRRKTDGKIFIIDWKTDTYQENKKGEVIRPSIDTRRGYFAQLHQYRLLWGKYHNQDWHKIGLALAFVGAEKLVEIPIEWEKELPASLEIK